VVSNKFTRDLQIDGMDIFDIRLAQEAITAGTLMRALRGQDPYLRDNRYTAIKELAEELAKVVAQKGPSAANQSMLQQIQELQRENARLKSEKSQGSRSVIPASPAHTPPPKGARTPKGSIAPGLTPRTSQGSQASGGQPTPPSYRRPKDRQSSAEATEGPVRSLEDFWNARPTDAVPEDFELAEEHEGNDDLATLAGSPEFRPEDDEEADPVDSLDTVQQFERTNQARFLEECKLDNFKVNTINNWVSQRVVKDKMAQVRLAGSELAAAIERLPAGNRPAVDAIAVQWGLPVNAAAKINERSLYQLIVYRSNLNAPWVGVMLSKLRLHEKKFPIFGTKVELSDSCRVCFDSGKVKLLIRSLLRQQKYNFPPLHLPSDKLVLRNTQVQCKCRMYRPTTQANLADTTFLQEDTWKSQVLAALTNWCNRWNGTSTIIQHLQREFEDKHPELQCYKWAFQWNRGLPNARILPKGSKNFAKARPIIAYTKCWHTKASSFLATALYSIMQVLFPAGTTLNISSVTAGLRQAWRYMQQFEQDDPVMIQQDLIGFFNSVPHSRICTALQLVLYQLQEHFGQDLDSLTFQVDHKAGTKDLRIFKGHRRYRGSTTKVLHIKHVMELTKFLLQSAYFKVGMDTFCQIQGACMGSPLAPVLCAMVYFVVFGMQTTDASFCEGQNATLIGPASSCVLISTVCPLSWNQYPEKNC
ncbi:unnamed protein product, partial [Symbiodinium necroappetens]